MSIPNIIYYNHIPNTGGRYVIDTLISVPEIKLNYIKHRSVINLENLRHDIFIGHLFAEPNKIIKDLKTVVAIRNPINRLVSHYSMISQTPKEDTVDNILKDFNSWLFNDNQDIFIKTNFQSKCLTNIRKQDGLQQEDYLENSDTKHLQNFFKNGLDMEKKETNYEDAQKYIDMCELILITEDLAKDKNKIIEFFLNGKNKASLNSEISSLKYESPVSKIIMSNINKDQIDKIKQLNSIDLAIYEYAKSIK
jgi:hypothetical protein